MLAIHRYNITSGANLLQDIAENKDEYTVVIEGGTAKLVQNSNILFAAKYKNYQVKFSFIQMLW